MPGAGPAEDDLVFPIRSLDTLDELEEHRLRVRREDPAHGEGHADGTEAKRIHRVESHDLRFVIDIAVHGPRVGDDDVIASIRADEGCLDFPETVWHSDRPALRIELGRVRGDAVHGARGPMICRNAAEG